MPPAGTASPQWLGDEPVWVSRDVDGLVHVLGATMPEDAAYAEAADVAFPDPTGAIPAGRYELRLDNYGNLEHTLVGDDLDIDLHAAGGNRDTQVVDLPPGTHLLYPRHPGAPGDHGARAGRRVTAGGDTGPMPEGHTIHRLARLHRADLAGRRVTVDSPQGRFADGAARLDETVLAGVDAYGKHLFYRWNDDAGDDLTLHVHLGLFGRFRTFRDGAPQPTDGTRLRMRAEGVTVHLAGAVAVELLEPPEEDLLRARLGPDPLARRADPEPAWEALQRRRSPIAAALLDQKVLAGIGNVLRAESLFACGLHPGRPANALARGEFDELWATLRRMLRAGERSGRIVTVDPAEVGARSAARVPAGERVYVYRRTGLPCRRCASAIESWTCAGRTISACPTCQPRR
ncbi:hypothetical protein BH23ACT8_BH23ACT8_05730 [soil metagenome]